MFTRFSLGRRKHRFALLFVFLTVSFDAAADSGDYRVREETLSTGARIVQRVDTTAFPQFQGERPAPPSADAPCVNSGHLRAIRALVPRNSNDLFAFAPADGSLYLTAGLYNHHLIVEYGGASVGPSTAPFRNADGQAQWEGGTKHRWWLTTQLGGKLSEKATHYLVTLFVSPRFDGVSLRERMVNLAVTVNEATVQGMNVVAGQSLANSVLLAVDDDAWTRWQQQPLRTGLARNAEGEPLALPGAFTSRLPFVEQRTIDFNNEPGIRRRDKRCLTEIAYTLSNLLFPTVLEMYLGRADLCSLDPHPNQDIGRALPLVEVVNREDVPPIVESTVFEAMAVEASDLGAPTAFDAAMDIQFCNAFHPQAEENQACTDTDRRIMGAIGDLTPLEIDELLAAIARTFDPNQAGVGSLRTGNDELDRWLNADLSRAANALNAAQAVVRVSDARDEPNEPVKSKKKKKRKLLKASCTEAAKSDPDPDSGDPFQECVRKAKRSTGETGPVVALAPHVVDDQRFHERGTPQFNRLVTEFRNSHRGMPWGIAENQFATFTAAIARDRAPTGDNLGLVFINDPAQRNATERFRYGVEHIWAPGLGGGDNAGHRGDWQTLRGLSINSRDALIQLVMTALTAPTARFTQARTNSGNIVRTFQYFVFVHGARAYAIRNVRIVLAQNGMVITAYPLRDARAEPVEM